MGLFDFLRGRNTGGADPLQKHAERVLDKRAMSPDRFASIEYLCNVGTDEAWRALLPRFNFTVDPSITDREEKQFILEHISEATDTAVEPVKDFLRKAQAVNWPIKMLRALLPTEKFVAELIDVLAGEETAYQKNGERKNQAIIALEDCPDPRVPDAVLPFLDDVSEDTRFHAVRTLLAQDDSKSAPAIYALLVRDDSMRIRTNVAEGLAEKGWPCPDDLREKVIPVLPRIPTGPFMLDPAGVLKGPARRA
jgi:HEAT repeat protein